MLQKKKYGEQNARVDVLLNAVNNSKDFWREIRKYRYRKFTSSDISEEQRLNRFKRFSMGMLQPRLRRKRVEDIPRTVRKAVIMFLMLR